MTTSKTNADDDVNVNVVNHINLKDVHNSALEEVVIATIGSRASLR